MYYIVNCSTNQHYYVYSKSFYISHAVNNFYGTGLEIWAGFWPVGNKLVILKKKIGRIMSNFEGGFFMGKKNLKTLKSCTISVSLKT